MNQITVELLVLDIHTCIKSILILTKLGVSILCLYIDMTNRFNVKLEMPIWLLLKYIQGICYQERTCII